MMWGLSIQFDICSRATADSPNVKLLYDIYRQQITGGNLINTITRNISFIGNFRVADVSGRHELGTGEINYANVLKEINKLEYYCFIGLEFIPLKNSKEALKKGHKI